MSSDQPQADQPGKPEPDQAAPADQSDQAAAADQPEKPDQPEEPDQAVDLSASERPEQSPPPAGAGRRGLGPFWLLPAIAFLVGLLLGGGVMWATRGEQSSAAGTPAATPSPTGAPSPTGTTPADITVTIPGACVQVAQDSQALLDLATRAAEAARDLDATRLSAVVDELQAAQTKLREQSQACQQAASTPTSS